MTSTNKASKSLTLQGLSPVLSFLTSMSLIGIVGVRLHDLRHIYAFAAAMNGVIRSS